MGALYCVHLHISSEDVNSGYPLCDEAFSSSPLVTQLFANFAGVCRLCLSQTDTV